MAAFIKMNELSQEEVDEILEIIHKLFHFDFKHYSSASIRRRVDRLMRIWGCSTFTDLKFALTNGMYSQQHVLNEITVNTTEMFRDPHVFYSVVENVFPYLKTHPLLKIWHAGCSTGEEVYSMAILLKESGLLKRSILYGTDINTEALKIAEKGVYSLNSMKTHSAAYRKAGGTGSLSNYLTVNYGNVCMDSALKKNMVFSQHDLINGASFGGVQVIICRNVFIYLKKEVQDLVLEKFVNNLEPRGFLILGNKESIDFSPAKNMLEVVSKEDRIFRKKRE